MGLAGTIRSAVKVANGVTKSLQEEVTHVMWAGQDGFGKPIPSSVSRKGIVEHKTHQRRVSDGRYVEVKTKLTILDEIIPLVVTGRVNPVDPRDKFIFADGTTGVVVDVDGLRNPGVGPFLVEVYLGDSRQ